ncbi:MAG: hypothetical protein C4342_08230 [Armatimonadota bacterium]
MGHDKLSPQEQILLGRRATIPITVGGVQIPVVIRPVSLANYVMTIQSSGYALSVFAERPAGDATLDAAEQSKLFQELVYPALVAGVVSPRLSLDPSSGLPHPDELDVGCPPDDLNTVKLFTEILKLSDLEGAFRKQPGGVSGGGPDNSPDVAHAGENLRSGPLDHLD